MSDGSLALFRDREFLALAGTAFARSQAYSTVLIALALYADLFTTTGIVEGLFGTAFAAIQFLIVLPLGRAIDTGRTRRFLLVGLLLNVFVFVGFVFVENAAHVVLMRVLQGVSASVLWITGSTAVGEISADGERGRWLGTYNQVGAISSLTGDLVGGYLLYAYGFTFTYVIIAGVTLLAFGTVYRSLPADLGTRKDPDEATGVETLRSLLGRPMVFSLVVFRMAFSVGKMAVIIFLPIYAHTTFGINAFAIGGILAGGKLTKSLLQGYLGDLTDRIGRKHQFVVAGALVYAVGTALIPLASVVYAATPTVSFSASVALPVVGALDHSVVANTAFLTLFAAYGVCGIADSIRLPASMALFVEEGEQFDSVASSLSLRSISWKAGQVVGPVLIGAIKDGVSVTLAFFTAAAFIVVATGIFLLTYARVRGTSAPSAAPGD